MQILILGAKGMLGTALAEELKDLNPICWGKDDLDITKEDQVKEKIGKLKADIIINCAGYTDVDGCEKNKEVCFNVNSTSSLYLTNIAKDIDATLVYISTDYIFKGDKKEGYKEHEKYSPINIYGKSKAEGEKIILNRLKKYYIIRTSWLFGKNGKNFVDTIIKLAKEKPFLEVVNDQVGCPTYAKDLAKQIRFIIKTKPPFGIYHITNREPCSWFEFAKEIINQTKIEKNINPITSEKLKRAAKRPQCSILINTKLPNLRPWKEALKDYLIEIGEY